VAERMFGLETEYAIAGIQGHKRINRDFLMIRFTDAARRSLVHLPDAGLNGMFLANGSRLYIDCGQHPELATPECTNPWDAVRYLKAGEMIIGAVIKQLSLEGETPAEIFCSACNVDYMQNTTWGCHESFLHYPGILFLIWSLAPFSRGQVDLMLFQPASGLLSLQGHFTLVMCLLAARRQTEGSITPRMNL
jgi:hypothetical protein